MGNSLIEILIPKETVSDDSYKISSVEFKNGDTVTKGQIVGSFETSKADIDIEAPEDGYIFYGNVKTGGIIKVGDVFAVITDKNEYPEVYFAAIIEKQNASAAEENKNSLADTKGLRISKSAAELIQQHNINLEVFKGKKLVTKEDVEFVIKKNNTKDKTITFGTRPKVVIIGAGGHAKICIDILRQNKLFEIVGATSNSTDQRDVMGVPVLGTDDEVLEKLFNEGVLYAIIGIGSLKNLSKRQDIFNRLKKIGFQIPTIIHPRAIYESSSSFGEGCQVMAGAIIGSEVRVCNNCIINAGSVISHDCYLEDNIHITPGAILAGNVYVGQNSIVGMGATIYIGVIIGTNVIVSNNANVLKDIPDNTMVAGNPAKHI